MPLQIAPNPQSIQFPDAKSISQPMVDSKGRWIDSTGQAVPKKYIEPLVRERDKVVRRAARSAFELHHRIVKVKTEVINLIDSYLTKVADSHEATWKGNAELLSFDGRIKVDIKVGESLEFDERLQIAKTKIDDCLIRWIGDARGEIQTLIQQAFRVDRKGNINSRAILTLRQFRFKDPVWQQAMSLISDSLRIRTTRRYLNVYLRNDAGQYHLLPLNWSAIMAEEAQ